jgi:RNA binding exosome subunit
MLREQLPKEDLSRLRREAAERLDEENHFHLRLDKQHAYKGMVRLTDSKDAIAVSAMVETYPARREEALRIVSELL